MKDIYFGSDARKKIKNGIDKCVDVVKVSLGKSGKNVLIYNGQTTEIINDGVSIARAVEVKDEVEQAGIMLAKECAAKTNNIAGDGTTTTLVLLQALLDEMISDAQLMQPRELREQIFKAKDLVIKNLEKQSKQVESVKDIENIATTSSLDPEIGKLIAEIYEKLGKDANIIIQETEKDVLESEIVQGIQFGSRNVALYSEENEQYLDVPVIVLKEKADSEMIGEKLRVITSNGDNEVLVIAPGFTKDALAMLVQFKMKGVIKVAAVKNMDADYDDLLAFGNRVEKVVVTKENTTLMGGNGDTKQYVEKLKEQLDKEESKYMKELLKKRISFLSGGIAMIKVGKPTDVERDETVLKIEDAINAAKSAYDGGLVVGGGLALRCASIEALSNKNEGERILLKVCEVPHEQILKNTGVKSMKIEESVVDSCKVIKAALNNAVSVATSILTAEAALIEVNED